MRVPYTIHTGPMQTSTRTDGTREHTQTRIHHERASRNGADECRSDELGIRLPLSSSLICDVESNAPIAMLSRDRGEPPLLCDDADEYGDGGNGKSCALPGSCSRCMR